MLEHPYVVYRAVPQVACRVRNLCEDEMEEALTKCLVAVSDRNKRFIPAEIYEKVLTSTEK